MCCYDLRSELKVPFPSLTQDIKKLYFSDNDFSWHFSARLKQEGASTQSKSDERDNKNEDENTEEILMIGCYYPR